MHEMIHSFMAVLIIIPLIFIDSVHIDLYLVSMEKKTFGSLYVKETFAIFETLINVEKHKYDVITGETTFFSIYRWNSFFVVAQFKRQLCT